MRRTTFLLLLLALPVCAGCTIADLLFGVLGDHYSAGGNSDAERKLHYNQQLEKWRTHDGGGIEQGSPLESADYYGIE